MFWRPIVFYWKCSSIYCLAVIFQSLAGIQLPEVYLFINSTPMVASYHQEAAKENPEL